MTVATDEAGLPARLAELRAGGVDLLIAIPCGEQPLDTVRALGAANAP